MGLHRTAMLLAVAHSGRHNNQNHTWTSLSGQSSSSSSDYYLSGGGGGGYYNGTGRRNSHVKNDFEKFHGNPNIMLGM